MKIRQGFVSNSSSSSFCIVGFCRNNSKTNFDKLLAAEGIDNWQEQGWVENEQEKLLTFLGSEEPLYAGMDAEKLLQTMTIPQAIQYVHDEIVNKFNIDVPLKKIEFMYGEIYSG